ncbi:hypothetical protein L6164_010251 [Bauhinia variegata]|uniref:Uncharacterized protein n=1 Tax=Bauhinia variegata TaxID=167791 RepID=A0ACB9PNY3_BAUVA|nr:hypothetical protein L6164_010251 [Bauhinia variegata]
MASATSMSIPLECVNLCKLSRGDGSGRYDCSVISCAWKVPRVLTGFLASTAHSPQCPSLSYGRNGRRNRCKFVGMSIFVFTPRGEIKNLPGVATVIDYAYMIHTEVGNKLVVAKVNGDIVSPTHVLANAEVVGDNHI